MTVHRGGQEIIPIQGMIPDYTHYISLEPNTPVPDDGWIFFNMSISGVNNDKYCSISNGPVVFAVGYTDPAGQWARGTSWLLVNRGDFYAVGGSATLEYNGTRFYYFRNRG